MQATIARRMSESKSTVPEFTVTVEARVDQAVSMRQQLKDSVPGAEKVTMTDFLVRACALALRKFPEVNSSWAGRPLPAQAFRERRPRRCTEPGHGPSRAGCP